MDEKEKSNPGSHKILLFGRKQGQLTGIKEVISFDAKEVVLDTVMGTLVIRGEELTIRKLTVETGEAELEGRIDSLLYSAKPAGGKGQDSLLKRMFR